MNPAPITYERNPGLVARLRKLLPPKNQEWTVVDYLIQEAAQAIETRAPGPNERVKKYKIWVESCDRGSFAKDSPSDIAIKAQIRCLRQLLEYLEGDEYLAAHVEDAVNRAPATGR